MTKVNIKEHFRNKSTTVPGRIENDYKSFIINVPGNVSKNISSLIRYLKNNNLVSNNKINENYNLDVTVIED